MKGGTRTILLAHGAGAGSAHPWLVAWAQRLGELGSVRPFDYPYMAGGRGRPDPQARLIEAHVAQVAALGPSRGSVVLIGKSMGGRIGCHASLVTEVDALVCFGYPLFGQGDPNKSREAVLRELRTPVLFVQGTRDAMCPLPALEAVRAQMTAPSSLFVVQGGDHSLLVTKTAARTKPQAAHDAEILSAIASFLG